MSVKCGGCGLISFAADAACKRCGAPLAGPAMPEAMGPAIGMPMRSIDMAPFPMQPAEAPRRSMSFGIAVLLVLGGIVAGITLYIRGHAVVAPHWQTFTAPDGRVTADFPTYPVEETPESYAKASHEEAKKDALPWHAFVGDLGAQGAVIVKFNDLSPIIAKYGSITPPQREKIMIQIEKEMASESHKTMTFHLQDKHWIEVQGGQGVEGFGTYEVKVDGKTMNGLMTLQTFWGGGDRIYVIIVAGPSGSEIYESRERVFASVHLAP